MLTRGSRGLQKLKSWALSLAWLGAVVAWTGTAAAQTVNVERVKREPARPGWSGLAQISFSVMRGNVQVLDVGESSELVYQSLYPKDPQDPERPRFIRQRIMYRTDARFAEQSDEPFISQTFSHVRWTGMWLRQVGSELFIQHQYNRFFRLRARAILGANARFEIIRNEDWLLSFGTGAMLEYERTTVPRGSRDKPEELNPRSNNYLVLTSSLFEKKLLLQETVYYQPRFDKPSDARVLNEFELLAPVSELVSLGLTLTVFYDSDPPEKVKTTDLRSLSTVRLSF
jgi:hypothetical protein